MRGKRSLLQNPYLDPGAGWLKGNLHTHTSGSDGTRPPQEIVDDYAARSYGFLMLSDHDCLTDPRELQDRGMVLLPGNEISAHGPHLLHAGAKRIVPPAEDRQKVIADIRRAGGLAILCHPNWEAHFNHCPQEKLAAWQGYAGIEIYNGIIRRLPGSPLATDRWDMLLGSGRRVWGFGNDDCHRTEDVGLAWNVVQCRARTPGAILAALAAGSFYASTGVTIETIAVRGRTLHLSAPDAQRIAIVSDFGKREACVDAACITFHVPDAATWKYIRVECFGPGESMAWTQPFYVTMNEE